MPTCIEKKILLSGNVKTFTCDLVHFGEQFGVLRYFVDRSYEIGPVKIAPGDTTLALYWIDRPYTLYIWRLNKGKDTAYYFNVADSIALSPAEFVWRDLAIDVLIDLQNNVHVLDEDELPSNVSPALFRFIESAKNSIIRDHRSIIAEAEAILKQVSPF